MPLFYVRPRPDDPTATVLRPLMGGTDRLFNTRYRDVTVGVTKPTAANTGILPGSDLRTVTGAILIPDTSTGELYENLDISGKITNQGQGTTVIRNCRIHLDDYAASNTGVITNQRPSATTVLIDCEVYATVPSPWINGVLGGNVHALRTKFHDTVDFLSIYNPDGANPDGPTNTTVEACYGYDFLYYSPDPAHADTDNATHNDGVQIQGGSGTVVRGSRFDMTYSPLSFWDLTAGGRAPDGEYGQGVTVTPTRGQTHGNVIDRNWFDQGVRGIIAEGNAGAISASVTGNRFGASIRTEPDRFFGPIVTRAGWFDGFPPAPGPATGGNVYEATGQPVPVYYRGA